MDKQELWSKVFIAVASSNNTNDKSVCALWADYAVDEYKKRFEISLPKTKITEYIKSTLVPLQEK